VSFPWLDLSPSKLQTIISLPNCFAKLLCLLHLDPLSTARAISAAMEFWTLLRRLPLLLIPSRSQ
jgi:hypothetical protein